MRTTARRLQDYLRGSHDNAFGYAVIAAAFVLLLFALLEAAQL